MIDSPFTYGPAPAAPAPAHPGPSTETDARDAPRTRPTRVFLANQPRLMRDALARLLERTPDLELAGAAASTAGLARSAPEAEADCVVVPLGPGTRPDPNVEALLNRPTGPRVVALSYDGQRAWAEGGPHIVQTTTLQALLALLRGRRPADRPEASVPTDSTDPFISTHTYHSMKEQTMTDKTATQQQMEGAWQEFTGRVKEAWGVLTEDDMQRAEGKKDRLMGIIEEKTGEARETIAEMLNTIERKIRAGVSDQEAIAGDGRGRNTN